MTLRRSLALTFLLCLWPLSAQAGAGLDVEKWLARPGVRLLAVEFYATWCKPCMQAVPRWKTLHDQYREQGLRLVVVATRDPRGQCVNPGWNPDDVICDVEGQLADAMRVGDALPAAFLWSWRGKMLVRRGHVDEVEKAVKRELASLPRVAMEPATGPDAQTISGLQKLLRGELAKRRKIEVVAGADERKALAAVRKSSHDLQYSQTSRCRIGEELAANSLLRVSLVKMGKGQRLILGVLSAEKGCLTASASVPWSERHPETSLAEAVAELMENLKIPLEMPGAPAAHAPAPPAEGGFGGGGEEWDPSAAAGKRVLVSFNSDPPGAVVMVDGQLVCTATPCKEEVAAGVHAVSMQKKSYEPKRERVDLSADKAVSWTLTANFALLDIQSRPDGAQVQVDGRGVGLTPITGLQVAPGRHEIKIADRCYQEVGQHVVLKAGDKRTVVLEPKAVPSAVDVSARAAGQGAVKAEVWVDGGHVGTTPGVMKVGACAKSIEIRHARYGRWQSTLSLQPKKVERIRAELALLPGGAPGAAAEAGRVEDKPPAPPADSRRDARAAPTPSRSSSSSGGFLGGLLGGPVERDPYAGMKSGGGGTINETFGGLFGGRSSSPRRNLTDQGALDLLERGTLADRRDALPFLFHRQRVDRTVIAAVDVCKRRIVRECVPYLASTLQHETRAVRHGAADALATLKEPTALEPLCSRASADPGDRSVMSEAAVRIATSLPPERLRALIGSGDPMKAEVGTRALAAQRGATPVEAVTALGRHRDPEQRQLAVARLAATPPGNARANQGLMELARDRNAKVAAAAIVALGERQVGQALDLIQEQSAHPHAGVRKAAFGALIALKDQLGRRKKVRLLKRCMQDPDADVRQMCQDAR